MAGESAEMLRTYKKIGLVPTFATTDGAYPRLAYPAPLYRPNPFNRAKRNQNPTVRSLG